MNDDVILIFTLSLIVIFSPFLARITKMLTTPVEIVLGSLLGYFGLLHHNELFGLIAEVGFLYLMFLAGTEINLKDILKTPPSLIKRVLLYITLLYLLSTLFTLYLNLGLIFMVILPLISVGLIATLTKEYGKTPWISIAMTAGSIGEVVSIGILSFSSAALQFGFGIELIEAIIALTLFVLFIIVLFRVLGVLFWWFPEVSTSLMPHIDNQEQDIRLSMGIFFILVGIMLYLELELAFGAFIAGIFIPTFFEHKEQLPEKLASYGFGFLIPIFFIHIGTLFNMQALAMDGLIQKALMITIIMIAIRLISALVFVKNLKINGSILLALSHSMPLTLLIAVATLAFNAQSIDKLHYYAFILASLFEVILVMGTIKVMHHLSKGKKSDIIISK